MKLHVWKEKKKVESVQMNGRVICPELVKEAIIMKEINEIKAKAEIG